MLVPEQTLTLDLLPLSADTARLVRVYGTEPCLALPGTLPAPKGGRFAVTETADDEYVFRASPLRNIALTAPYFHSGKVWDLKVAVQIMAESQLGEELSDDEASQIVAFLDSLTGTLPEITVPVLPAETATTPRPTAEVK